MAKLTFRDRFYTPQVARAITGPLGIILAGGGVAVGIVVGLPVIAAVAVGAAAYGVRVAAAIPKGNDFDGINPFALEDPWRTFVWQAKKSQRQFAESVKHTHDGPLRDRLNEIADRINTGVSECWQVAQSGQALTEARARIDLTSITTDLSQLPTGQPLQSNPALAETAKALQSQLDTAKRMDEIIANTRDRLRLLDARLGELVTRVIELSVRPQGLEDLAAVGADVDSVVNEMEALRQALDETDRTSTTSRYGATTPVPGAVPPAAGAPPLIAPGVTALPSSDPLLDPSLPPLAAPTHAPAPAVPPQPAAQPQTYPPQPQTYPPQPQSYPPQPPAAPQPPPPTQPPTPPASA